LSGAVAAIVLAATTAASAQTTLKLVTQTVSTAEDARKRLPQVIAESVAGDKVGLDVKVYYDRELVAAAEMYRAVKDGTVDMAIVFLPTSARDVPEVGFHGMPGVAMGREDAKKINASPAMKQFAEALEAKGVVFLGSYWDGLAIGSTGECIKRPVKLDGVVARGPGRPFEAVVEAAGAIPVPFASPEIPRALKTGAIDLVITTPTSMMVAGGHKHLKCVTDPASGAPGMVGVATLANKAMFGKLNAQQQAALRAAGAKGSAFMEREVAKFADEAIEKIRADGVKIVKLDEADLEAWRKASEGPALRSYAAVSPQAAAILKSALQALNRE
jgi:TRAP-type C4-dicarboxylate transport system substrate-binding protein